MSRAEGFAAVPNWMIRDRRVPRNAVLVYASLSSRAGLGGIFPSQATLATESGLSVRTVRSMLHELEELGVVRRERRQIPGKKRASDGYTLHPNGSDALAADSAGSPDLPAIEARSSGNETHDVPLIEVEPPRQIGEWFEDFYRIYPRKVAKAAALKAFMSAAKDTAPEVIIAGASRLAADPNLPEKQYIPYPASWLNGGRWDDEPLPPRIRPTGPGPAGPSSDDYEPGEEWAAWNR